MKVLTCSRFFPKGHPKAGQETDFVEKVYNSLYPGIALDNIPGSLRQIIDDYALTNSLPKHHTIRAGNRWKVGDMISLRIWSDKPYRSKQIEFAQVEVKKTWEIEFRPVKYNGEVVIMGFINGKLVDDLQALQLANNDGLTLEDFERWFCPVGTKFILGMPIFTGQIICWSDAVEYIPSTLTEKSNA